MPGIADQLLPKDKDNKSRFGLRLRMALLFAACVLFVFGYVMLYWFPKLEKRAEQRIRDNVATHLITVAETLKPFMLQRDLGAIHELLPATLESNRGWLAFFLYDANGRRLYPLIDAKQDPLPNEVWVFRQPVSIRADQLGRIELAADFSSELRSEREHNVELAIALLLAMLGSLAVVFWFFETFASAPIRQLSTAANDLSAGNFSAPLPVARSDEIGDLVLSFAQMRDNLQRQREEILRARDRLEHRVRDRTRELTRANEALVAASAERERIEQRLRQSQKMEALGKLTGGVAHDFNNLLAVIGGHAELLRERVGEDASIAAIERATDRAAQLTQHLLSFSRQQRLNPVAVELPKLIDGLAHLYHRTLGAQVSLVTEVEPEVWPVFVDVSQLDNALLNLAINARDAMPGGGTLEIRCANLILDKAQARTGDHDMPPGDYVRIDVADTGTGIPPEVLARVFEPFFTTKDVGKGSGLGLSMVYGFARQSGGEVLVHSEPGRGTRVSLILPRADLTIERSKGPGGSAALPRGDGIRVLVLEDEPDVRSFIVEVLETLGYQVISAEDARQAADRLDSSGGVDLVLSDVVLPGGVSGPEFVEGLLAAQPELDVVFMTGYAPDEVLASAEIDGGRTVLRKPFTRQQLAEALSRVRAD